MNRAATLSSLARKAVSETLCPRSHPWADNNTKEILYGISSELTDAILGAVDAAVFDTVCEFTSCSSERDDHLAALERAMAVGA